MLVLDAPLGGGFVLSYSLFALSVGFGRSTFAVVSSSHIFGLYSVLVSDLPFGGGFVLSFGCFALGVGFGRHSN